MSSNEPSDNAMSNQQPAKSSSKILPVSTHTNIHKLKKVQSITATSISEVSKEACERDKTCYRRDNNKTERDSNIASGRIVANIEEKKSDKTLSGANFVKRKLWTNVTKCYKKPSATHLSSNEEENEMLSMLTKQLYAAETQIQKVTAYTAKIEGRLQLKEQENIRLKRKVKDWEIKFKNEETLHKKEKMETREEINKTEFLHNRCLLLEHKIIEMEKFLADYGLIWVGDTESEGPECEHPNYIDTCYDRLLANIDQLNVIMGKDEVHVHRNEKGGGASFKTPSCVSLKFYKNGLILKNGPLRSYKNAKTNSFICDILDGYFPSELQTTYPNGVPFKVEDRRKEIYIGEGTDFPGHGYKLGKNVSSNRANSTVSKKSHSFEYSNSRRINNRRDGSTDALNGEVKRMKSHIIPHHNATYIDLLNQHVTQSERLSPISRRMKHDSNVKSKDYSLLPNDGPSKYISSKYTSRSAFNSSVVRTPSSVPSSRSKEYATGRIRQRSRSMSLSTGRFTINSKTSKSNLANGNTDIEAQKGSILGTATSPQTSKSLTQTKKSTIPSLIQINKPTGVSGELRLKIRSLNGGNFYLVHISIDEPIIKLYQLLDKAMPRSINRGYKIVLSGYTPRRLDQMNISLKDYGITGNSVLHLVDE